MPAEEEESTTGELSELKEEVSQIAQELLSHRKVLEQLLEMREGVMELLEHRETFAQCLELREGMQVVLGSARIISEMGDKSAELELSLAGVSDNTARHGKAISNITELHKRSQATLDAVVRAVKRLDRSRSRCRDSTPVSTARGGGLQPSMATARPLSAVGHRAPGSETTIGMADWGAPVENEAMDDAAWTGPGWSTGCEEQGFSEEDARPGSIVGSSGSSQEIRSGVPRRGGSAAAPRTRRPSSRAGHRTGHGSGFDLDDAAGIPDPSLGGPGGGRGAEPVTGGGGGGSAEMAHCVKGVLARIEEALTKLDGSGQDAVASDRPIRASHSGSHAPPVHGPSGSAGSADGRRAMTPLPTARAADPWADPNSARNSGNYGRRQRTPSRPQSASARRGGGGGGGGCGGGSVGKPGVGAGGVSGTYPSSTPRRRPGQRGGNDCAGDWPQDLCGAGGARRAADSWA